MYRSHRILLKLNLSSAEQHIIRYDDRLTLNLFCPSSSLPFFLPDVLRPRKGPAFTGRGVGWDLGNELENVCARGLVIYYVSDVESETNALFTT